jgi:hypothetical protein
MKMTSCSNCGGKIEPGDFHSCVGSSLKAPWLEELLETNNRELKAIRELLEKQAAADPHAGTSASGRENPEPKGRAAKRETR